MNKYWNNLRKEKFKLASSFGRSILLKQPSASMFFLKKVPVASSHCLYTAQILNNAFCSFS